jgi:hypothetical protein
MAKIRIPFAQPIESRTASFAKDSYCANGYFESRGNTKEFIKRPGYSSVSLSDSLPAAQGQGMYVYNGYLWVGINDTLYQISSTGVVANFGTISSGTPQLSFTETINDLYLFIHNGTNAYYVNKTSTAVTQVTGAGFPSGPFVPGVVQLDGYTVIMSTEAILYNSSINDPTTWGPLDFLTAEAEPDHGVAIVKHFNYIVAFKQWSTEFFYDANNSLDSPFLRNDSLRTEIGCANGNTVQQGEQTVIWCGQSKKLGKSLYLMEGVSPIKVSTPYIEKFLNADPMTNVKSWLFKIEGHTFYGLNLISSNITLVYDIDQKTWNPWTSQSGGVETYFTPSFFASFNGDYYFLDDVSGELYIFSTTTYSDNGNNIYYRSVTDIFDAGSDNNKFYRRLVAIGDKVSATLKVRYSSNDYQTFSSWRTIDLSKERGQLLQLGKSRRRSWEFLVEDNVPLRLDAAEVSLDIGGIDGGDTPSKQGAR